MSDPAKISANLNAQGTTLNCICCDKEESSGTNNEDYNLKRLKAINDFNKKWRTKLE